MTLCSFDEKKLPDSQSDPDLIFYLVCTGAIESISCTRESLTLQVILALARHYEDLDF